jgi:chromosomal replication initiation ATPase DnaA
MYHKFNQENKALILKLSAEEFSCTVDGILAVDRSNRPSNARHVAMAIMKAMLKCTLTEVAAVFGKHYTTVIHAKKRVDEDKQLKDSALTVARKFKDQITEE